MPPPPITGAAAPGKTLHQRTKSTPAFSTLLQAGAVKVANKKVLGEANANSKISVRDDSDIGKASPGKINAQDSIKPSAPAATFARPAPRPLAPKPSAQNISLAQAKLIGVAEPEKKLVAKKSTKVLKDVPEAEIKNTFAAPVHQPLAAPRQVAQPILPSVTEAERVLPMVGVQRQEVHKIESVPLRDEPATRPQVKPASTAISHLPPGFQSQAEFQHLVQHHEAQYQKEQLQGTAGMPLAKVQTIPQEVYYDVEEECEYEDGYTTARSFGMYNSTGDFTTVLAPKYTDKIKAELLAAKQHVLETRPAEDVEDEQWDTSMVAEYGDEIFEYMRSLESRMLPNARYMDQQTEIQWSMRSVLMDWVVQVHQRFNLLPETLFLTVNYIDRFLSCKIVSLGKLQLVGATAIFVAAKYEEVQCPTISEIIYMVDGGYSADELLKAERFMLSMLQFELGWPGPMSFLRRISKADDYDLETRTVAKYFLEVTIMDERFVGCTPSFLAAGAHCMARLMIHGSDWSKAHVYYSNFTWSQLRQLLLVMLDCCEEPAKHHSAVYEKYQDKRYKKASLFVEQKLAMGFRVPVENPAAKPLTPPYSVNGQMPMMR